MDRYTTTCRRCRRISQLIPANCAVHLFRAQPWLSYIQYYCTECQKENNSFFGPENWHQGIQMLMDADVGFIAEDYASDNIAACYSEIYDIQPLVERELTLYEERLVEFFHYQLERGEIA